MAAPATQPNDSAGDLEALWRSHHRVIRANLRQILPESEVDDVLQETFLSAWLASQRLDPSRSPTPWLATIARNRAIDRIRRKAVRPGNPVDDETLSKLPGHDGDDPAEDLVRRSGGPAIDAIRELPDPQRRYVILHHLDGYSLDEIASDDGTTIDSVKAHLFRARRSLRAALANTVMWPIYVLERLRRELASARVESTSATSMSTLVVTAAMAGLLAAVPGPPSRDAISSPIPPAATARNVDVEDERLVAEVAGLGTRSTAAAGGSLDRTRPNSPPREDIVRVDTEVPNPVGGQDRRRWLVIWLEDDGNDSVVVSTVESTNAAACEAQPEQCPHPLDWFKE